MKRIFNEKLLPWLPLGTGIAALLLRVWLFAIGPDARGLLPENHISSIGVYVLAVLTLVLLTVCLPDRSRSLTSAPTVGVIGIAGQILAAAGILIGSFSENTGAADGMVLLNNILAVIASLALVLFSVAPLTGRREPGYALAAVTVYFMIHLVCQYRYWRTEPQLQNYLFQLLGSIFLMIACYHRTALSLVGGKLRGYVLFNQAAMFCSIASLNTDLWPFYLAMSLWTLTDYCTVMGRRSGEG